MMLDNNSGNYPIQHNLGSLNADPGFVERAAKFSCFGNNNTNDTNGIRNFADFDNNNHNNNANNNRLVAKLESGKLSRVNSG